MEVLLLYDVPCEVLGEVGPPSVDIFLQPLQRESKLESLTGSSARGPHSPALHSSSHPLARCTWKDVCGTSLIPI